jgi:predicted porin
VCKHFYEPEPFVKPLEKIEMKKTLVAVAAIFAATGAMADATISGFLDGAYTIDTTTTSAGVSTKTTTLAPSGNGQSQITFGASEDLGGGLKAFANMRFVPDVFNAVTATSATAAQTGGFNSDVSEIGVSGAFGTIQLEKGYGIDFLVHAAADASGWTGSSTAGVVHNSGGGTPGQAVVYVLPTMVPGVGVVVARGLGGQTTGAGDAIVYKLTYSAGALALQYAGGSVKNAAGVAGTSGFATDFAIGGNTTAANSDAVTLGSKTSLTALAVTYDLGMAKLHYGSFGQKNSTDSDLKSSSTMMGVSVPFGATTFSFTSSSAKRSSDAALVTKASGTRAKVSYALSKRTTAYGAVGSVRVDGSTAANKQTAIGLTHSF